MTISRRDFLWASGLSTVSLLGRNPGRPNDSCSQPRKNNVRHSSFDGWIELDFRNMAWNLKKLRKQLKVPIMAVIKANGYGHGQFEVARFLESQGIDSLMVGKLQEALLLRKAGIQSPILNFGPFAAEEAETIIQNNISQSVFTTGVEALSSTAVRLGEEAKVHVHVDTGMGRAGIPYYRALPFLEMVSKLEGIEIAGVSTTLTEDFDFDREQLRRFLLLCGNAARKGFSLGRKHAASSSAVLTLPESFLDLVRPGITLYGYYPSQETQEEDRLNLKPVLQLKSRVYEVKTLRPGDSVSYHRAYTAKSRETMALIPLGYSDGYPFRANDRASVLIRGRRFPLIGTITANHMEVLLGRETSVTAGDEVVLIGHQGREEIVADEVARWAGVSVYKILIGLNPLLPKRVV